jgi:metallo-beta-lactamase family protein
MGAATILLEIKEGGETKRLGFTGDLGKDSSPLIPDPEYFKDLDYLVSESTYGGRLHTSKLSAEEDLKNHIEEALVDNYCRIIIPAFSVGRTQDILFTINKLFASGKLKPCKVFTDSPLAIKSTEVYDKYKNYLNEEALAYYHAGNELFEFKELNVIRDRNSADMIKTIQEPFIVVSAAGMVEGGRIKEHIKNNIQNPSATILIAGYCSKGTLGARLLNGTSSIRIEGQDKSVHAFIKKTDAFSAHPDHAGLKKFIDNSTSERTKKVFLVHGDPTSSIALKEDIKTPEIVVAIKGQVYPL